MSTITYNPSNGDTAKARLNLRVAPNVKVLLHSAAKLQRSTLSGFILKSSQDAAEAVLAEQTRFVLPEDQWLQFNAILDAPAKEIPAFTRLMQQPSIFEKG